MQGKNTHEQQLRMLEDKPDVPDARQVKTSIVSGQRRGLLPTDMTARKSEFPISTRGLNQESDHNKHNDRGPKGHKPQQHTPAEEKQN